MSAKDLDPSQALQVKVTEQLIHRRAKTANVSGTDDLAAFFGSDLDDNVGQVIVTNVGIINLNYQVDGTDATAAGGTLLPGASKPFFGRKAKLDDMRLFAASANPVSVSELISE